MVTSRPRYDLEKFDEVTVNGRPGFVVNPRYPAHLGVGIDGNPAFVESGCVVVKFFGNDRRSIIHPDDVIAEGGAA